MDLDDKYHTINMEPSSNQSHEQTPVGGASSVPQDESRGLNEMTPEDLNSLKNKLNEYAEKDMWKEAAAEKDSILKKYPDMVRIPLTDDKDTALHVAVKANSINFVKGLVNLMTEQDLEIQNRSGRTAFFMAAESGKCDLLQIMINKNQNLPLIKSGDGFRPVLLLAARLGQHKVMEAVFSETLLQKMDFKDIEYLFLWTIEHDMFDVAIKVFEEFRAKLAIATYGRKQQSVLEMLFRKPSKELSTNGGNNIGASPGESLLKEVWRQLTSQEDWIKEINAWSLVKVMADVLESESGNVQAVEWLLSMNPELLFSIMNDDNGQNILHYAVQHRQKRFVSFIFKMKELNDNLLEVDSYDNSVLHYAAYPLEEETSSTLRATTKLKNEVAWFKEVEKNVPRELRTMRNKEGMTPKEIFLDKHMDLSREVKDTAKGIAESGMLVAALVATVAFAAAVTVPGDKTNTWFTVFIWANAAALFTSSASILSFLSNFTSSRFADREFVKALHPSLINGRMLLLISIVTMVISFAAASFLIFEHTTKWAAYVVASMGVFPILLFLLFQFSIFDDYLWSRFYRMSFAE